MTLAECRASCREMYRHLAPEQLPAMVQVSCDWWRAATLASDWSSCSAAWGTASRTGSGSSTTSATRTWASHPAAGGPSVSTTLQQILKHNILRADVLFHRASYNVTQVWLPKFTKVGFEKVMLSSSSTTFATCVTIHVRTKYLLTCTRRY